MAAFENRASFPIDWQLGEGVAKVLEDTLYQTGRYRVLDREDIDRVLAELEFQKTGKTREEEAVPAGRLKNAHYLVSGVITEFAHVDMSGWDLGIGFLRIGGGGVHAIVNIAMKVVEVESGEVVYSKVVEGKAYAGDVAVGAVYEHIALGGYRFFRTPLGRALREALDTAVEGIEERIPMRRWQPAIAAVDGARVLLNGGREEGVAPGSRWIVRLEPTPVYDPLSGDRLGSDAGEAVGTIRVTRVEDHFAAAAIEDGQGLERGMWLEPLGANGAAAAPVPGAGARGAAEEDSTSAASPAGR